MGDEGVMPLTVEMFPDLSMHNRENLRIVPHASCYQCIRLVNTKDITDWTDDGTTALCPNCDIDSLIAGVVDRDLLKQGNVRWFCTAAEGER